jgi:Fe-S-cluster containining protein
MSGKMRFLDFLKKPGFTRQGSCKKCGNCCRNIVFKVNDNYIASEDEFEKLKKWKPRYNHFYISGRDEDGALLFTCKSLNTDNACKSYRFRSLYCRLYPRLKTDMIIAGTTMLDGCGYYYKSSIDFKDYLQKSS